MLYRIYTEDKNEGEVEKICSRFFPGFTVIKSRGFWRLQKENSLIIEIEAPEARKAQVNRLALAIKLANTQEAVMVQELKNDQWLI